MILETIHGFQHITDVLNGNAVATTVFFVLSLMSLKLIATLAASMVRDDAKKMEWYSRSVEGATPSNPHNDGSS
ncbi:MAG: hypothetical protein P8Y78_06040 [Acidihalobacter sp.]|jgi:hypothetical protein